MLNCPSQSQISVMQSELSMALNKSTISATDIITMLLSKDQQEKDQQISVNNNILGSKVKQLSEKLAEIRQTANEKAALEKQFDKNIKEIDR